MNETKDVLAQLDAWLADQTWPKLFRHAQIQRARDEIAASREKHAVGREALLAARADALEEAINEGERRAGSWRGNVWVKAALDDYIDAIRALKDKS